MGAWNAPGRSQDRDGAARARFGADRLALRIASAVRRLPRPSTAAAAIAVLVGAVAFVGAVTWYGARTFSGRAAEERAAGEAASFASHSGLLATGDAFEGYLQLLRYAEDPAVSTRQVPPEERVAAMRRLLFQPRNSFSSLTLASLSGTVFASTDPTLRGVRDSQAFVDAREDLVPTNSDVVLEEPGRHGYVEFATPLREPGGGVWAIFMARADPAALWRRTLAASVDGGRNVLVNSEGEFAAGVPEALLGRPWEGVPLADGAIRAEIDGTASVCGLAPIGVGTQIDHGWHIASCLPKSLVGAEQAAAQGKQTLVTLAVCVLAALAGALAIRSMLRREPPLLMLPAPVVAGHDDAGVDGAADPPLPAPPAPVTQLTVVQADVDAVALIDAYEQRAAAVARELRDDIGARLLLATAQLEEAGRLREADADAAGRLERTALAEIEEIRERALRGIGQDLHPSLVRLGLPAALNALRSDLADVVEITLDVDPAADAVDETADRGSLEPARRVALYRLALESARSLANAGAAACSLTLARAGDEVALVVEGAGERGVAVDWFAAHRIAVEAYGGSVSVDTVDGVLRVRAAVPAQDGAQRAA
jgi:hypothetical protein